MSELIWSWLALPYVAVSVLLLAVILVGVVKRGDRVMRLGVIGCAVTALPWAVCSALAACTQDWDLATRLHRLGQGPVSLVGPNFMLVLLGISGQLERHRWIVRLGILVGSVLLALCWATDLTVPTVQRLSSGMLYTLAGPLTDFHNAQLVIWLAAGGYISRRSAVFGEKRSVLRIVFSILGLGLVGSLDFLTVHGVWGAYPIAWLPAGGAAGLGLYLNLRKEMLRKTGIDRGNVIEVGGFLVGTLLLCAIAWFAESATPLAMVAISSVVWTLSLAATWALRAAIPQPVTDERALQIFVAGLADLDEDKAVVERTGQLWKTVNIDLTAAWRVDGTSLVEINTGASWTLSPPVIAWFVQQAQAIAPGDLAIMWLGHLRAPLEAAASAHGASLLVPLVDRDKLVGLIEANHAHALREEERELLSRSARAAARSLTYARLARVAISEGETAREVEIAEAMRRQAAASRDDELGRWTVVAEYRTAERTTGAGWSASLLADGRLAVLVTEAQAHGVAAALATATLTGAFAAATSGSRPVELDDLLASMRASADGVMRGGEPIAAFLAVIDGERHEVAWAAAGHPGAFVVGPVAYDVTTFPEGSLTGPRPRAVSLGGGDTSLGASLVTATKGVTPLPRDALLVVTSSGVRNASDELRTALREQATTGPRLAHVLVELAAQRDPTEDLLAVVVRQRPDRPRSHRE